MLRHNVTPVHVSVSPDFNLQLIIPSVTRESILKHSGAKGCVYALSIFSAEGKRAHMWESKIKGCTCGVRNNAVIERLRESGGIKVK